MRIVPDIVNSAGIAERLGVGRPTVTMWRQRHADFPTPLDVPGVVGVPLFYWPDVLAWHSRRQEAERKRADALARAMLAESDRLRRRARELTR